MTSVSIIDELGTIKKLQQGYSIARFGDGEFRLINNKGICFQKNDAELSKKLLDIVTYNNIPNKLLVAIPPFFAENISDTSNHITNSKVQTYWDKYMKNKDSKNILKVLKKDKIYYSSFISRLESFDLEYKNMIKEEIQNIWSNKKVILIVNPNKYELLRNNINGFIGQQKIERIIYCPEQNAYDIYTDIYMECMKCGKEYVYLLMMGPTASVLAKDLTESNFHAIDIGSFFEHM